MNWILIGIFILAIISILVVFLISRNVDCSQKDGSADHVANYVYDKKLKSCIPSTCMDGYGPLSSDGTCPDSIDCSKKDGTADHVSKYIYNGKTCVPSECMNEFGPLTSDFKCLPNVARNIIISSSDYIRINFNNTTYTKTVARVPLIFYRDSPFIKITDASGLSLGGYSWYIDTKTLYNYMESFNLDTIVYAIAGPNEGTLPYYKGLFKNDGSSTKPYTPIKNPPTVNVCVDENGENGISYCNWSDPSR